MTQNVDNEITIQVDGQDLKARRGQMLIEVTDEAGIYIPRFCYHPKLSVAANCRMCLVEMEKGRKPMPACATPVADGNVFFTRSKAAIAAQRATMEFLLINHPLDCPICDQGGECELQDLAMGYGRDISRYSEKKRVVKDKDLGPLISTDMTRCIHCTRCVRFGEEVAGIQELGTIGRGEQMQISTFIERSVDHELSGNIIDLCPVGALNSKPLRYQGRSWEMRQFDTVAPHDCVGSNLHAHVLNGKVMRMVPRTVEAINETWISDRDRFSYAGVYSEDRLHKPMVRGNGGWREVSWLEALDAAAGLFGGIADKTALGTLVSPQATLEEQFLAAKLTRALGSGNIDHRLRRSDTSDQDHDPVFPWLGCDIAQIEKLDAALIVGSNIRREAPIIAHRLRKASLRGGKVMFLNPPGHDYLFDVHAYLAAEAGEFATRLQELIDAAHGSGSDEAKSAVAALKDADDGLVLLGHLALRHSRFAHIRTLASQLAAATGARLGYLADGGNSVGGHLAGALPHRLPGGQDSPIAGQTAAEMLAGGIRHFILLGVEPEHDSLAGDAALSTLKDAASVVCLTSFVTQAMQEYANVLLPIGTFVETAGTFVNAEGRWQSFTGVARPVGESRPAWKVLRVMAETLGLDGFGFDDANAVRDRARELIGDVSGNNTLAVTDATGTGITAATGVADIPMYALDPLLRRSAPLQQTADGKRAAVEV